MQYTMSKIVWCLAVILTVVFTSCGHSKKGSKRPRLTFAAIDSIETSLKKDSTDYAHYRVVKEVLNNFDLDTISRAWYLHLLMAKDTNSNKTFALCDSIFALASCLEKDSFGRFLLAKTAYWDFFNYYQAGDFDGVVKSLERFLQRSTPVTDTPYKSIVLTQLAAAYERLGDTKRAIYSSLQAIKFATLYKDDEQIAGACLNLSISYQFSNEVEKAKAVVEQGLKLKNVTASTRELLLSNQIEFTSDDDLRGRRLNTLLQQTESPDTKYACHTQLAELCSAQGQQKQAVKHLLAVLPLGNLDQRVYGKTCISLSQCYAALNLYDSAQHYANRGLAYMWETKRACADENILDSVYAENTIYDLLLCKANNILTFQSEDSTALRSAIVYLNAARKTSSLLRKTLVFDESKYDMSVDMQRVAEKILQVHYMLYKRYGAAKDAEQAFIVIENSKALSMQDHIEQSILYRESQDSNYAQFIALNKEAVELESAIALETNTQAKGELENQYAELIHQMATYKNLARSLQSSVVLNRDISDLRDCARENAKDVVHYFVGDTTCFAVSLSAKSGKVLFMQVDTAMLSKVAALCQMQRNEQLFVQQADKYAALSYEVYTSCLAPLCKESTRLQLCTDGVFNNLAFDALSTSPGDPRSFLLKRLSTSYAYSLNALIGQRQLPYSAGHDILAIAPFTTQGIRNYQPLPHTLVEIKNAAQIGSCITLVDTQAKYARFLESGNTKYLHMATHGRGGDTPSVQFFDSSVMVNSIYNTPMHHSLVYLNMCESASGRSVSTEGTLNLGRAFYSNGAHNIIYTYWNLNDASGAYISNQVYKAIAADKQSDEALHLSKLEYLKTHSADERSPYYWASLQHLGDGKLVADTSYNTARTLAGLAGAAIALVLFWWWKRPVKIVAKRLT
jgi:CHAT domain-containing protein